MRKIVAIAGRPGTGKTTIMRKFMEPHYWERCSPAKLVETMYCLELDVHILGKYEDGEVFAGTDKLSMACQPEVTKWLKETNSDVIYEGDRLTGTKFYDALLELANTKVTFLVLSTDEETLTKRYEERGSEQNETFLAGRASKINNILTNFTYMDNIVEMTNTEPGDVDLVVTKINDLMFS